MYLKKILGGVFINKSIFIIFVTFIFLVIYTSFYYFSISFNNLKTPNSEYSYYFSASNFFWPVPGFHTITSYFGKRTAPTTGASTFHSGIDIAAIEGSNIYSIISGKIVFTGFKGAGGCTITMESDNLTISYCHVSPNYLVIPNQIVSSGELIGNVGPKFIYGITNNPYSSNGKPTNGATTRSTSTSYNKKRRPSRQSFRFF